MWYKVINKRFFLFTEAISKVFKNAWKTLLRSENYHFHLFNNPFSVKFCRTFEITSIHRVNYTVLHRVVQYGILVYGGNLKSLQKCLKTLVAIWKLPFPSHQQSFFSQILPDFWNHLSISSISRHKFRFTVRKSAVSLWDRNWVIPRKI